MPRQTDNERKALEWLDEIELSETCKTCRFFKMPVSIQTHTGNCLRMPPSVPSDDWTANNWGTDRRWPIIGADDWCGEWRPAPQ